MFCGYFFVDLRLAVKLRPSRVEALSLDEQVRNDLLVTCRTL